MDSKKVCCCHESSVLVWNASLLISQHTCERSRSHEAIFYDDLIVISSDADYGMVI